MATLERERTSRPPLGIPDAEEPWAEIIRTPRDAATYIADWAQSLFGRTGGAAALEALADAVGGDLGDRLSDTAQYLKPICTRCREVLPAELADTTGERLGWCATCNPVRAALLMPPLEAEELWQEPALANVFDGDDEDPDAGFEVFDGTDLQMECSRC